MESNVFATPPLPEVAGCKSNRSHIVVEYSKGPDATSTISFTHLQLRLSPPRGPLRKLVSPTAAKGIACPRLQFKQVSDTWLRYIKLYIFCFTYKAALGGSHQTSKREAPRVAPAYDSCKIEKKTDRRLGIVVQLARGKVYNVSANDVRFGISNKETKGRQ